MRLLLQSRMQFYTGIALNSQIFVFYDSKILHVQKEKREREKERFFRFIKRVIYLCY